MYPKPGKFQFTLLPLSVLFNAVSSFPVRAFESDTFTYSISQSAASMVPPEPLTTSRLPDAPLRVSLVVIFVVPLAKVIVSVSVPVALKFSASKAVAVKLPVDTISL